MIPSLLWFRALCQMPCCFLLRRIPFRHRRRIPPLLFSTSLACWRLGLYVFLRARQRPCYSQSCFAQAPFWPCCKSCREVCRAAHVSRRQWLYVVVLLRARPTSVCCWQQAKGRFVQMSQYLDPHRRRVRLRVLFLFSAGRCSIA